MGAGAAGLSELAALLKIFLISSNISSFELLKLQFKKNIFSFLYLTLKNPDKLE